MSKNVITVGTIDENEIVLPFSSKGPAHDGRLKPEIVAFSVVGTSNACALVTGAASMIQQLYVSKKGELPQASLVKAALLNGANDVGRPGIDFETGYGNLNVLNSLNIIESGNYFQDSITNNETHSFELSFPDNAVNLKIMLVWTDIPASPNDNIVLKNNLDLNLNINEETFLPSVLNANANLESLESLATTGIDNLNPVEQITIEDPNTNNLTINVSASNLVSENQEYSIVYSYEIKDEFEWVFPSEDNYFPYNGGNLGTIRWNSSYNEGTSGILEINFNDSEVWETLDSNVDITKEFYNWEFLEELHGKAKFRLAIDDENFVSEEFLISSGVEINSLLNCDDVVQISWDNKENAVNYNIFNLENQESKLINSTIDTSFVYSKTDFSSPYFYVQPQLINEENTLASLVFNSSNLSENCYFNSIFPSLTDDGISLEVNLSSIYDIDTLELFRVNGDGSLLLVTIIDNVNSTKLQVFDTNPLNSENIYQFKITTNGGDEYLSETSSIFSFSEKKPFLLFPNPAKLENGVSIFSNLAQGEVANFELFDLNGRLIMEQDVNSDRFFINLNEFNLSKGIYIYSITGENFNIEFTSKLIIE